VRGVIVTQAMKISLRLAANGPNGDSSIDRTVFDAKFVDSGQGGQDFGRMGLLQPGLHDYIRRCGSGPVVTIDEQTAQRFALSLRRLLLVRIHVLAW
jgi:hypothetical protein